VPRLLYKASKETSSGVQDQLELVIRSSTVDLSLELRVTTKKEQFPLSLHTGKVQGLTGVAGVR